LLADEAHEVIEEGELLAHEGAVHAVLAGDLVEQAAKLGAAGASQVGLGRRHQPGEAFERDARRLHTELDARAREDRDAVRLEAAESAEPSCVSLSPVSPSAVPPPIASLARDFVSC